MNTNADMTRTRIVIGWQKVLHGITETPVVHPDTDPMEWSKKKSGKLEVFNFHAGVSERSNMKLTGQTKTIFISRSMWCCVMLLEHPVEMWFMFWKIFWENVIDCENSSKHISGWELEWCSWGRGTVRTRTYTPYHLIQCFLSGSTVVILPRMFGWRLPGDA